MLSPCSPVLCSVPAVQRDPVSAVHIGYATSFSAYTPSAHVGLLELYRDFAALHVTGIWVGRPISARLPDP